MNIAILTPIPVEHDAMLVHLPQAAERLLEGNRYFVGKFNGRFQDFQVILHQSGSKNENTVLAVERIIRQFNPVVVILCGVAGGVKDVAVGDLAIGTKYYGYEFGKVTPTGFATRPESGPYSRELLTLAQSVASNGHWRRRAKNAIGSKVVFGPIAAGNKVIAATDSDAYRLLKQTYNDTTAIEMEAVGFGLAMQPYPSIRFLNVRGISDLLDGKSYSDASGTQEWAADNMAAFVFELLYQLDVSQFKIFGSMDVKELAKRVIEAIAQQDSPNDAQGSLQAIVQSIQPLIGDELRAFLKAPQDADAKADAKSELRRALEGRETLAGELELLLKKLDEEGSGKVVIKNSKNVVQGSRITVGGDFRVGDDSVVHHSGQQRNIAKNIERQININTLYGNNPFDNSEVHQKIEKGKIDFQIPISMTVGKSSRSIVRIYKSDVSDEIFKISKNSIKEDITVSNVMIVELIDAEGGTRFKIYPLSDLEQVVQDDDYTEWQFNVIPLTEGIHVIILKVSMKIIIKGFGEKPKNIIVMDKQISVMADSN